MCAHAVAAADSDSVAVLAEAAVLLQHPALDPTHSDRQDPSAFRVLQLLLHFHQAHYQHWDLRLERAVEMPLVAVAVVDVKMAVLVVVAAAVVSY